VLSGVSFDSRAFGGIKNDQEINDLWAYLKQFDANGNIKK
jgi:hypothetical protein